MADLSFWKILTSLVLTATNSGAADPRVPLNETVTRPRSYGQPLCTVVKNRAIGYATLRPIIAFCHIHASLTLWPLWSPSLSLLNQAHSVLRDLLNKTAQLTLTPSLRGA